ncbi:Hypothetical protein I596_126 [Dokdonella koreensis DS-123]|uniref:Uncharacterized protein n=1 Tax=Dokdonella koreensis DS-123 TaxID=1300342 RepID=A0A167G526_9GAMM|nr:Hypothetical protein I596_126 [Dokdonella koreensis DS-123]
MGFSGCLRSFYRRVPLTRTSAGNEKYEYKGQGGIAAAQRASGRDGPWERRVAGGVAMRHRA